MYIYAQNESDSLIIPYRKFKPWQLCIDEEERVVMCGLGYLEIAVHHKQ